MKWFSSNNRNNIVNTSTAILSGLPNDKGLWMPEEIPIFNSEWIDNLDKYSISEICSSILTVFFQQDISKLDIETMVSEAINFPIPLYKLDNNDYILELFHGPTMAFKDFGARIMALIFQYLIKQQQQQDTHNYRVLVATSGDTGGAVANAFSNTNIPVTIFYPNNRISEFQEKQITIYGKNISCFKVDGTFDDCQAIVKSMLQENNTSDTLKFITANSINISRLIPQVFYYFISYSQLLKQYGSQLSNYKIIYSIPSGNMGNSTAGLISKLMGLPIDKIIIATNSNDTIPRYLKTKEYQPKQSVDSLSNAMDVGDPSNFKRLLNLSSMDIEKMKQNIDSISIDDIETTETIHHIYQKYQYLLDPHTAVGYSAINKLYYPNNIKITLATASPYKFKDIVEKSIQKELHYPLEFSNIMTQKPYIINYHSPNKDIINKLYHHKTICFIGMPGSGKTTIAKQLHSLGWNMIDTDEMIIDKYQTKLVDVVNLYGDEFINIETDTILSLNNLPNNTIISPGGSVVYSETMMNHLKDISTIILLDSNINDLLQRVDNYNERGIVMKPGETLEDLYHQRLPLYHKYKELSINNSVYNITETVNLIHNLV